MITIPITYTGMTPSMTETVEIVSGQRETIAVQFSFSEDWNAYKLRTAMFSSRTATRAQMIEEDGTAVIPSEAIRNGERYVKISAFGTIERADGEIERYNGRAITLRIDIGGDVEESGGCTDATAYEKLLVRVTALEERVDNIPAGGGGGGSSVALDTTLTKKGYAADAKAVGDALAKKVGEKELDTAVETALAEAKKSGEFDGPPGEPGTTPHIGANGNWWTGTTDTGVKTQGDNYVLTDADKTEIAEEAAELVDVPEKLPNPNALTFSGAVTGTYDGSAPLNVVIPSGGGGTGGASVELDSTLTQPGKAADAKAVGDAIAVQNDAIEKKLDAEELPAAVETALAEAKKSGEFDGPPGQPGAPGDDYVLTDGDIDEIASAAAGKINISGKADKTTVPNSAIVNADNELVMQRTDGDAVAELFKVALPASGGGGVGMEELATFTTEEEVQSLTIPLTRDIAKRVGDAGKAYLTCNIKKSQEDTNTDYGKVTARYINARANGSLMVDYQMISAQPIVPRTDQGHAYIDYRVIVEKNVLLWGSKKYTKLQIGTQNPTFKEEGFAVRVIGFEDRADNVYKITIESTTKMGAGSVFAFGVM